jgi:DNA-binding SARP family transcriptional activator
VELSAEGLELPSLAPRHRAFLGYLLLHSGTVLSVERLSEAMWGPTRPDTARAQVHAALTAIRRTLRAVDAAHLVETRPAGYVITPEPDRLDLQEFTTLVAKAGSESGPGSGSEPAAAVRTLREALALWRGAALADVQAHFAESARARLEDRRPLPRRSALHRPARPHSGPAAA